MRLLAACSLGGAGHLNPLIPFLVAARRQGDDIVVVGPPTLGGLVGEAGFSFHPGGEPSDEDVAAIRARLPIVAADEASVLGNRELFGRLATGAMLPEMERFCAGWDPEFVLREPGEYASAIVSARRGTPIAQVAISVAEGEASSIATAAPALEELRNGLVDELWAEPYLTSFPASLDPSPFPTTIRFRASPSPGPDRLADWWQGSDAPLVYVTFGTILGYMPIAAGVYRAALRAVERLEVRVLLTVGRRFDLSTLGPVPAHVRVERWIPQAKILNQADLVVCHGGSGTAYGALAAGVPLVIVPLFADQFGNGERISAAGAARVVQAAPGPADGSRRPITEVDAPRIASAIREVLNEISYRRHARRIASEMASVPTVEEVLTSLLSRP